MIINFSFNKIGGVVGMRSLKKNSMGLLARPVENKKKAQRLAPRVRLLMMHYHRSWCNPETKAELRGHISGDNARRAFPRQSFKQRQLIDRGVGQRSRDDEWLLLRCRVDSMEHGKEPPRGNT